MAIADTPTRLTSERRFYCGMAIAMIVLVLIGFAPSFYFIGMVAYPRPNPSISPLVLLHGLAFSLWMLLFATQAGLVAANRRDLHMKLGMAGFAFAAALVPLMYVTAVNQVARATQSPFTDPLSWTSVPLFPIPAFIALVVLGWRRRRDPFAHKRLMLGASLLMMDPAIGRFPIAPPTFEGFAFLNLLSWLLFVPLFLHDRKQLGRIHWASALGAGLFAAALLARLAVMKTGVWAPIAAHLPGVGLNM